MRVCVRVFMYECERVLCVSVCVSFIEKNVNEVYRLPLPYRSANSKLTKRKNYNHFVLFRYCFPFLLVKHTSTNNYDRVKAGKAPTTPLSTPDLQAFRSSTLLNRRQFPRPFKAKDKLRLGTSFTRPSLATTR